MRYGQPTLPEGHVDEADRLKANENEMFTVTSEQEKNLYLKGYSGGRYIDGCWKPLSNADYSGEYSGMLKWLAKLNFHPLTQAAEYYTLSDAEQEDIPETNELQMNVAGAYRYPVYAPASLYQAKGRHAKYKKDAEMISKGIVGARHYTLDEISNAKPSELMIAQNWVSDPQNEAQKQYSIYSGMIMTRRMMAFTVRSVRSGINWKGRFFILMNRRNLPRETIRSCGF